MGERVPQATTPPTKATTPEREQLQQLHAPSTASFSPNLVTLRKNRQIIGVCGTGRGSPAEIENVEIK